MNNTEFALIVATVLCAIGFAALIVVLLRVLDTLRSLRSEVESLRRETGPLLEQMRSSAAFATAAMHEARSDLERFDRVLGSAEAISDAVAGGGRVAKVALSAPVIKAAGLATGTRRAVRRFNRRDGQSSSAAMELVSNQSAGKPARQKKRGQR